jgi:hypothetical protein
MKIRIRIIAIIMVLLMTYDRATAQPFLLTSVDEVKAFRLKIYYGTDGKGAFVQYQGHQEAVSLKLKNRAEQGSKKDNDMPLRVTYVWDELVGGKVTGSYGLTQDADKLSDVWYRRNKDGKHFRLASVANQPGSNKGVDKYLLHGVLITFYHTTDQRLTFSYHDAGTQTLQLPGFDHPDPLRTGSIADYNFDGYDDVAFSIPDAGMGVYRTFNIFLYDSKTKRFQELAEPGDPRSNCSGLCNVRLDPKSKLLFTSCRGAATWWKDVYKFSKWNKLVWVSSEKQQ